MNIIKSY